MLSFGVFLLRQVLYSHARSGFHSVVLSPYCLAIRRMHCSFPTREEQIFFGKFVFCKVVLQSCSAKLPSLVHFVETVL